MLDASTISVMFFCLGNICRSPLAEALFRHAVEERALSDRFLIASSGTSAYHVGAPPDPGSVRVARERLGLDISQQRGQQLIRGHVEQFHYLVAMDRSNQRHALALCGPADKAILLLRDFEPSPSPGGRDVPDPWGGGASGFEEVYEIVSRCTRRLLDHLVAIEDL